MTIAYGDFITAFPEFSDATKYPQAQADFWLTNAYATLNAARFGKNLDLAAMLYTAHYITLSARDVAASSGSGFAGSVSGPMSSKSVGPVSVGYDTGSTTLRGAAMWNSTSYGVRFYQLLRIAGAGGAYVGGNPAPVPNNRYWPPVF
jgi:hypothetical protein